MPIRILDAATVGRIAAGEVIERPASIAKELIENALDAGSSSITVEIREGGIDYIRVTDNGCGLSSEETRIAFENHATSKISSGDELTDILTLGFRGEALPSIAAVARVTMTTRTRGSEAGTRLRISAGHVDEITQVGCPEGTTIVVSDLFYNLPVRRTFLKKPATEAGYLGDMVVRLILANPNVAIRLINNGRTVYHSYGDGNLRHTAMAIYGREAAEKMLVVDESEGALRMRGLIGLDDLARPTRSQENFFINGRTVRVPLLSRALENAVRSRVMIGMYPICALSLTVPPTLVDVNVHPSKLEVRFRDEADIQLKASLMLTRACSGSTILDAAALSRPPVHLDERARIAIVEQAAPSDAPAPARTDPPPDTSMPPQQPVQAPQQGRPILENRGYAAAQLREYDKMPPQRLDLPVTAARPTQAEPEQTTIEQMAAKPVSAAEDPDRIAPDAPQTPPFRIIGVFARTYILVELGSSLLMIDQHAAHERILYERYKRMLDQKTASQQLLVPMIIHVSPRERDTLMNNQDILSDAGYEIEPFGENDLQIRAVPFVLGEAETRLLLTELIDRLDQLKAATIEIRRGEIITASCKHAVKGGDALTDQEVRALIDEMIVTQAPPNCPHGRPIIKVFTLNEVEKMFRRIV